MTLDSARSVILTWRPMVGIRLAAAAAAAGVLCRALISVADHDCEPCRCCCRQLAVRRPCTVSLFISCHGSTDTIADSDRPSNILAFCSTPVRTNLLDWHRHLARPPAIFVSIFVFIFVWPTLSKVSKLHLDRLLVFFRTFWHAKGVKSAEAVY